MKCEQAKEYSIIKVIDSSSVYKNYKDLNEYWVTNKNNEI